LSDLFSTKGVRAGVSAGDWPKGSAARWAASCLAARARWAAKRRALAFFSARALAFSAASSAFLASALVGEGSSILTAGLSSFATFVAGAAASGGPGVFVCSGFAASVDADSGFATSGLAASRLEGSERATSGLTASGVASAASVGFGGVSPASIVATFVSCVVPGLSCVATGLFD
jgi:hypothetical protein